MMSRSSATPWVSGLSAFTLTWRVEPGQRNSFGLASARTFFTGSFNSSIAKLEASPRVTRTPPSSTNSLSFSTPSLPMPLSYSSGNFGMVNIPLYLFWRYSSMPSPRIRLL